MKQELKCIFTSDLHGNELKYEKLFQYITEFSPDAVFLGGDLSISLKTIFGSKSDDNFFSLYIYKRLLELKDLQKKLFPKIFLILGNDDSKALEEEVFRIERQGLWQYVNEKYCEWQGYNIFGYSYVPPTPFLFKDWERYDVSRFLDPGSIAPEEGIKSSKSENAGDITRTIKHDLESYAAGIDFKNTICLFHSPPYKTVLDRGDLDGKFFDNVPLDVHLGSIAIYNFIEKYQPLITMHGHIHESTRLTGSWKDKIGRTCCFNGSHDGSELSIISFDPGKPGSAKRELI